MTKQEFKEWADGFSDKEDCKPDFYPEFESAILGIVEISGKEPVVLYDKDKVILILMLIKGMMKEEAEDWFYFNMEVGSANGTPGFGTLIKD